MLSSVLNMQRNDTITISTGLVELRRIETAEEVASQMASSRNVVYLPQGQQTLLALPQ